MLEIQNIKAAVPALLNWYTIHKRALPWRKNADPYAVWVSEIMLQQTRIEAVIPHYHAFLQRMPHLQDLADIAEEELLKYWEGLGYYSRVRNMQKAAKILVKDGRFALPNTYAQLIKLPGIGEYTAAAIASICFGESVAAVDGNVMRVVARLLGDDTNVLAPQAKKHFRSLAETLIRDEDAGKCNQAMMELGETICLPNTTPKCAQCPFAEVCFANRHKCTERLPVRVNKTVRKTKNLAVCVIRQQGSSPRFWLHKRPQTGLLAKLYEFPNCEDLRDENAVRGWLETVGFKVIQLQKIHTAKHLFTHLEWQMQGYFVLCSGASAPIGDCVLVTREQIAEQYAIPSAFRAFTEYVLKQE